MSAPEPASASAPEPASAQDPASAPGSVPEQRRTSVPGNALRGALIGTVETVPGVSGGTVALVVGIYHQIIDSASHVVSAVRRLLLGPERLLGFREELAGVQWKVVLPVAIGMLLAVFSVAGPVADAFEAHPERMRGLFFGMVLASVAVPVRMILHDLRSRRARAGAAGEATSHLRLRPYHLLAGVAAAVATFLLVSLPPADVEAHPAVLVPAAAVAVSALVLPGLSGSFLLLTFGLYEPTLRAVDNRDLGYLSIFMLGMVLGMIVVVKVLKWLLEHRHTITMVVLTGVMVGGLRSLWPWQDEMRRVFAPSGEVGLIFGLMALGLVVVAALVWLDARLVAAQEREARTT
ncbi:DUF368 domain-containing protein [Nesterenkonia aerolata]|nr:DUF368 domain-containing protein [Nesterenkonia sp. LY-0111]